MKKIHAEPIAPSAIAMIRLADGDHRVSDCELVRFAVVDDGEPTKLQPTLRYLDIDTRTTFWTPLATVLGFAIHGG